ncbi:uncharacterized protein FYW23_010957 [Sylvia borin]
MGQVTHPSNLSQSKKKSNQSMSGGKTSSSTQNQQCYKHTEDGLLPKLQRLQGTEEEGHKLEHLSLQFHQACWLDKPKPYEVVCISRCGFSATNPGQFVEENLFPSVALQPIKTLENAGIDPATSRMLSERSTI